MNGMIQKIIFVGDFATGVMKLSQCITWAHKIDNKTFSASPAPNRLYIDQKIAGFGVDIKVLTYFMVSRPQQVF